MLATPADTNNADDLVGAFSGALGATLFGAGAGMPPVTDADCNPSLVPGPPRHRPRRLWLASLTRHVPTSGTHVPTSGTHVLTPGTHVLTPGARATELDATPRCRGRKCRC